MSRTHISSNSSPITLLWFTDLLTQLYFFFHFHQFVGYSKDAYLGVMGSTVGFHSHFTFWSWEKLVSRSQYNSISIRPPLKGNKWQKAVYFLFFGKFPTHKKLLPFLLSSTCNAVERTVTLKSYVYGIMTRKRLCVCSTTTFPLSVVDAVVKPMKDRPIAMKEKLRWLSYHKLSVYLHW